MPEFISFPVEDSEFDSDSDESNSTVVNSSQFTFHCNKKIKLSIDDEINNCYENDFFKTLEYDDESFIFSFNTVTTEELSCSSSESVGNASLFLTEECFKIEADKLQFDYHGPKVLAQKNETPVTIFTASSIGTVKSRRLFRILLRCDNSA